MASELIVIFVVITVSYFYKGSRLTQAGIVSTLIFFFIVCGFFFLVYSPIWDSFQTWEVEVGAIWNLSNLFASLPWNDISFLMEISSEWVTNIMQFCYDSGYKAMFLVPALPCFLRGDSRLGWKYILCGHLIQSILIIPELYLFGVQEIWYVKHIPDGLNRVFNTEIDMIKATYNCFPSMHTSIATAMLLVSRNEPSRIFRYSWMTYCILVIISTVCFPIHWVIDLIGGVLLGIVSVTIGSKIVDWYNTHNLKRRFLKKWNQI
ncbi:MAG: hypothetical protein H6Q69_1679 [Firmicutes bacterium]|nr:hypothetical protein [Bacillota bacterium]